MSLDNGCEAWHFFHGIRYILHAMQLHLRLWKGLSRMRPLRQFLLRVVNDQFLIGVTGVIFNDRNQVLLVKHTYRSHTWSLPGGFLQHKENPKQGLEREILEETGFVVRIIRIIMTKTSQSGSIDLSYFGELVSGTFQPSAEVSEYKFVSPKKLPKLIKDQYEQISEGLKRKKAHDARKRWQRITDFILLR